MSLLTNYQCPVPHNSRNCWYDSCTYSSLDLGRFMVGNGVLEQRRQVCEHLFVILTNGDENERYG
jgi:hypothetical protein